MRVLAGVLALACADIVGGLAPSHGSSSRASLRRAASSVDLRVGADAALADRVLSPGEAMRELYDGFNAHDLQRTAAVLDDDCVYEVRARRARARARCDGTFLTPFVLLGSRSSAAGPAARARDHVPRAQRLRSGARVAPGLPRRDARERAAAVAEPPAARSHARRRLGL